jgi:hypothetical protein
MTRSIAAMLSLPATTLTDRGADAGGVQDAGAICRTNVLSSPAAAATVLWTEACRLQRRFLAPGKQQVDWQPRRDGCVTKPPGVRRFQEMRVTTARFSQVW